MEDENEDFRRDYNMDGTPDNNNTFFNNRFFHSSDWNENTKKIDLFLPKKHRILLYPGTGEDVFVPLHYLNGIVDEFYFVDVGSFYRRFIMTKEFDERLKRAKGFSLTKKIEFIGKVPYCEVQGVMFHNFMERRFLFKYFCCTWEKLLSIMKENNFETCFLYIYASQTGEGGTGFHKVFENNTKEHDLLSEVLSDRYICINEGDLQIGKRKLSSEVSSSIYSLSDFLRRNHEEDW